MGWMSSRSRNTWPWVRFVVSRDGRRPWVRFVISWRVLQLQRSVYEISEIDLLKIRDQVLPKSEAGQAVSYALKNWAALTRYFVGSDRGGRTMAVLRSFVASCELAKVDPFAWFHDVLFRIGSHSIHRLDELLPHRWAPAYSRSFSADPTLVKI
jgi:hypothetical protein